jgi:mono/diheme cytochrome c family protein
VIRAAAMAGAFAAAVAASPAAADPSGAQLFARCATCHLSDGAGVPGAFPSLRSQIGRFAGAKEGRAYLVAVVTHGLTGALSVGKDAYSGFMPAQSLSDAEAAAVLSFLVRLAAPLARVAPFTAAEVAAIRARSGDASAQDSRALRPDALAAAP